MTRPGWTRKSPAPWSLSSSPVTPSRSSQCAWQRSSPDAAVADVAALTAATCRALCLRFSSRSRSDGARGCAFASVAAAAAPSPSGGFGGGAFEADRSVSSGARSDSDSSASRGSGSGIFGLSDAVGAWKSCSALIRPVISASSSSYALASSSAT
eukprot:31450-Pelagococcus_subviridis.AAC.6